MFLNAFVYETADERRGNYVLAFGLFGFAGGFTNWLAINYGVSDLMIRRINLVDFQLCDLEIDKDRNVKFSLLSESSSFKSLCAFMLVFAHCGFDFYIFQEGSRNLIR